MTTTYWLPTSLWCVNCQEVRLFRFNQNEWCCETCHWIAEVH